MKTEHNTLPFLQQMTPTTYTLTTTFIAIDAISDLYSLQRTKDGVTYTTSSVGTTSINYSDEVISDIYYQIQDQSFTFQANTAFSNNILIVCLNDGTADITYTFEHDSDMLSWLSINEGNGLLEGTAPADTSDTIYYIIMRSSINGELISSSATLTVAVKVCTVPHCHICVISDMQK